MESRWTDYSNVKKNERKDETDPNSAFRAKLQANASCPGRSQAKRGSLFIWSSWPRHGSPADHRARHEITVGTRNRQVDLAASLSLVHNDPLSLSPLSFLFLAALFSSWFIKSDGWLTAVTRRRSFCLGEFVSEPVGKIDSRL